MSAPAMLRPKRPSPKRPRKPKNARTSLEAWRESVTEDVIQEGAVAELIKQGFIVEIVTARVAEALGCTRGIGDLLLWRTTYADALKIKGFKRNVEAKRPVGYRFSAAQKRSLMHGGLAWFKTVEEALAIGEETDRWVSQMTGVPLSVLQKSKGGRGV